MIRRLHFQPFRDPFHGHRRLHPQTGRQRHFGRIPFDPSPAAIRHTWTVGRCCAQDGRASAVAGAMADKPDFVTANHAKYAKWD